MLFSMRIENPVVVLLPLLNENSGVGWVEIVALQIGEIETPYVPDGSAANVAV
jgi:hypothetical protein